MKAELEATVAKQTRLLAQLNLIEETQQAMVKTELQNIEVMENADRAFEDFTADDMASAAEEFPEMWQTWLPSDLSFSESLSVVPDSSPGS